MLVYISILNIFTDRFFLFYLFIFLRSGLLAGIFPPELMWKIRKFSLQLRLELMTTRMIDKVLTNHRGCDSWSCEWVFWGWSVPVLFLSLTYFFFSEITMFGAFTGAVKPWGEWICSFSKSRWSVYPQDNTKRRSQFSENIVTRLLHGT